MTVEVGLEQASERLTGEILASRYQIEAKIGEGAMGAVYRAKHVKVGRAFAVKVLHPRLLADLKTAQRFEREAELAGRLRHPNVIGVIDVGETPDGMRYMVMDFAAGPDLATLLNEAPFAPPRIIHIVRQLLEGLYHAHEAGLIHRDFKPENVIIEKDTHGSEVPRIVDFGIAILREGGDSTESPGRLTTNGLVLGTPHYMAPEQAVADPIDHRIDLFALGIIIYEMLSGKLPFDGNGAEVARANLLLDPPPIAERVPYLDVDPLLEAFARRLMAKKRDARPATAKVARDLLDLIDRDRDKAAAALGVPAEVVRAPQTTQPQAPVRTHTGNDTFPPPLHSAPTERQAPSMIAPKAVSARADEPYLTTAQTSAKKNRTPLIVAAIASLSVLGGAAFVMLSSNKKHDDTVAATAPANAEPDKTEPAPAPADVKPAPEPPPPVEVKPADVAAPAAEPPGSAAERRPTAPATPTKKSQITKVTKTTKATKTETPNNATTTKLAETKPVETKPVETKPVETKPVETKPVETKPVETKPVETKPAEAKQVTAQSLATQYQSVGSQLKALQDAKGQDAVNDLWSRYRMIRFADAMSTQPKRDEASAVLAKLATEIAARKK